MCRMGERRENDKELLTFKGCGLFYQAVSSVKWKGDRWIWKGTVILLNWCTSSVFAWRDRIKSRKALVRIVGSPARIRREHLLNSGLEQWYSTWGTRRHLRGYVTLKKIYILFHDKHLIIRARFRVSHRRPGRKDIRFGSAISLSRHFMRFFSGRIVFFYSTQYVGTWLVLAFFSFETYYLTHYFGCNFFYMFTMYNLNYAPRTLGVQS
jgi:hypothetical protein